MAHSPPGSPIPNSQQRSDSFPISSPSWWNEAATVPTPPLSKRQRETENGIFEDGSVENKRARSTSPGTMLSYLPNRLGPIAESDPHAYLAAPEYAPNRFGDIGDYMRKKEVKIQTQNRDIALASAVPDLPQIFTNLSFYINGNTNPPMEEIRKMILQRGGECRPVLRSKGMVKFIIAPVLTNSKFKEFERYKVVKEGWIVESCKEGKLLDWTRWKLQVKGGWEEGSRKGMEGFLKSTQSSTQTALEHVQPPKIISTKLPVEVEPETGPESTMATPTTPMKPTTAVVDSRPRRVTAATQSLLAPTRPAPIPISPIDPESSPSKVKSATPSKIAEPEGGFEWYHSKEPNKDAERLMKDREWRTKNTAERGNEGGFIDGYYQNSRLHHLSTWKAELKVLVAKAQTQSETLALAKPSSQAISALSLSTSVLPRAAPIPTVNSSRKYIFHVDFDAFFLSCGLATRPHLKGIPAVVCHASAPGRQEGSTSEIASASYEARAKGVRNGMSLGKARELVGQELVTIPYEFETYKKFSLAFYTILMGYADDLQAVSVDEALIDVTSAVAARELAPEEAREDYGDTEAAEKVKRRPRDYAVEVAEKIRDDVRAETGCEVSIGISHNILLAKLATRRAKPAGVFHLLDAGIFEFLAPLDIEDLPSIGHSTAKKIEDGLGTTKCGELLDQPKGAFRRLLGPKTGEMLWGYLRGLDDRKLERDKERKSVSAEMNYGIRFRNDEHAEICVQDLAAEVSKRMKQVGARGKLVTLKLMRRHPDAPIEPPKFLGHGWCETFNKSAPIGNKGGSATDDAAILGNECVKLLKAMRLDPVELRGVGIQVTKLDGGEKKEIERQVGQGTLHFGAKSVERPRTSSLKSTESLDVVPAVSEYQSEQAIELEFDDKRGMTSRTKSKSPSPKPIEAVQAEETTRNKRKRSISPIWVTSSPPLIAEAGPSRIPRTNSLEDIDPEYLAALPPEFQQMAREQHAIMRGRAVSENPAVMEPTKTAKSSRDNRATTVSPAKTKGRHAAAHITKQLRPMVKTSLKTSTIAELPLYSAWSKSKRPQDDIDVLDDVEEPEANVKVGKYLLKEIKDFGIDPDYFGALPEEDQEYVISEERRKRNHHKILYKPANTSRVKALERQRGGSRLTSLSPSRSSRGGSLPPVPRITVPKPTKPALFNQTELPNILDVVTRWIDSRSGSGPAQRDAGKVRNFLMKCLGSEGGLGGVEVVVGVLRLMRGLIRERWGDEETVGSADGMGREWWITWRGYREDLNKISLKRFGAPLRL